MDLKHFPDFYRSNVQRIYRFLYFRVRNEKEIAQDLTQDVFLKAFAAFDSYDPEVSQSSWIFTIARNHLINYVQKQRPGVSLEEIEQTMWDKSSGIESESSRFDTGRLLVALQQLPEDDRRLVEMKHLEGWSYDEIAKIQGKNVGALRVQSHRALKALQKILKHR